MASNINITIGADAAQALAQFGVLRASVRDAEREFNNLARTASRTGNELDFAKTAQAASRVNDLKTQMEGAARSGQIAAGGMNQAGSAAQQLSFQVNDLVTQVASGTSVMQALAQQGGQIAQIFQMNAGAAAAFLSPLGLMAVAGTAAAVGLGYLAYQAYQVKQTLGGIGAELLLTGRGGSSLVDLGDMAEALAKKFDMSKSSAAGLLAEVAGARTLSKEMIGMVAELAAAEGAFRRGSGESVKDIDIAKKLASALSDGAASAIKLADGYNISTTAATQMLRSGDELGAFRKTLADIADHIRTHGGAWAEAKARADEYQRAMSGIAAVTSGIGAPDFSQDFPPPWPSERPTGGIGAQGNAGRMRAWLDARGYFSNPTAAIMGNARIESGFDPAAVGPRGHVGLFQWDQERRKPLGGSVDFNKQMELMDRELTQLDPGFKTSIAPAPELAERFDRVFARSGGQMLAQRRMFAEQFARGGAGANQFAEKSQRESQLKEIERDYEARAIVNRNSLQQQVDDARSKYNEIRSFVRNENKDITEENLIKDDRVYKALVDLNQKQAKLYDQDVQRQISALRAKQAAALDLPTKIGIQDQIIGAARTGGLPITQIDQLTTERAALERQQNQESINLAEERLSRQRQMGQLEIRLLTAREQARVASGVQSQAEASAKESAATDAMLAKQREGTASLLARAQAEGMSERQTQKYADAIRQIDIERAINAANEFKKLEDAAKAVIDKWVQPVKQAFDQFGASIQSGISGLLTGKKTWGEALKDMADSAVSSTTAGAGSVLSRFAARGLFGANKGENFGEALFNWGADKIGFGDILGLSGQSANTAAIASNTAAVIANTAALGVSAGAEVTGGAAGAIGGAASVASGGGIFSWLGGLLAFSRGGIVPSAAGGWALPSFPGAQPALLHSREMVLPAHISEGLQGAIGGGRLGGGGDVYVNFNGPADGPSVDRWFRGQMARNPGAVRNMFRSNALTPRTV